MRNMHADPRENAPVKNTLTGAERQKLVERHFETARLRQAESDFNLLRAVELGKALQRLKSKA